MDLHYLLLDKDKDRVSLVWKVCHVLMLIIVTTSGFAASFLFGKGLKGFGSHCILYADVFFYNANETSLEPPRKTLRNAEIPSYLKHINFTSTNWSSIYTCHFCQCMPLMSMISAIIWITVFAVCGRGGSGSYSDAYSRPWRVVYPALCFSAVTTILMFASSFQLYQGLKVFCSEFQEVFNVEKCTKDIDIYTAYFNEKPVSSITQFLSSSTSSWICCGFWFLHTLILIARIISIPDFRLVEVFIMSKNKTGSNLAIESAPKSTSSKIENGSSNTHLFNDEKIKDENVSSSANNSAKDQRSPSFNYVDDSPHIESETDFPLTAMKKNLTDSHYDDKREKETLFQAPRADLSSL